MEDFKNPTLNLLTAMEPNGIERQEKRGQSQFVNSEILPTRINSGDMHKLIDRGLILGEVVEGDPEFQNCTLPDGWKKEPTEHSMWSKLVDENGVEVASIFFKAAFYDRSAHLNII